jgi:hypothetical protein
MRAASSVLMRFASLASRSSMLRQNASRASTVGVSSIEPSPAMCSWQTLPAIRRVSTEAHLQAVACLTEANKHDAVARRKTTRRCQANEVPLRTGSGAIRFAEHLIGGVPDCTQGLDAVLIPVSAKDLDRVKPEALHVDTNTSGQRHLVLRVPLQFLKLRLELRQLDDARRSGDHRRGCRPRPLGQVPALALGAGQGAGSNWRAAHARPRMFRQ